MLVTKQSFGQITGRQYIHIVQSFSEQDQLDAETAHEIGEKLLNRFEGFQGVVATHTDRKQLHNHIVLNSVNWKNGHKWQLDRQGLYQLREESDRLCREYGLSTLEKNRGWQQSGEYRAGTKGWKQQLARDIARCLDRSFNRQDFLHQLDSLGLDADFGKNNVMFFVREMGAHRYGLEKEMSCQNGKLMSYGDFSKENIENLLYCNQLLLQIGMNNGPLVQEALSAVGAMLLPNASDGLQETYVPGVDFSGLTRREIEIHLKNKMWERLSRSVQREYEARNRQSVLPTMLGCLEELMRFVRQREEYAQCYEDEEEYEM